MHLSENFIQALQDYIFLLNKKYPERSIHELVSTRYALNNFERSILYRGITTRDKAEKRKARLITIEQLNNRTMHVDLFNVLFTIAAYLRGFPVYLSNDGILRDASESHDSNEFVEHLVKSLGLLLDVAKNLQTSKIIFYLDNPLHLTGMMAKLIEDRVADLKMDIEIIRDESPDHLIRKASDGVIATSDSSIVDKSSQPVLDLPRYILRHSFNPRFIELVESVLF